MPKFEVYASETVYSSCIVEANSPEEAMHKVEFGEVDCEWVNNDSDDFTISCAEPYYGV